MKYLIPGIVLSLLVSCEEKSDTFTPLDIEAVNKIRRDYTNGWLASDSETVLGLFAEDATIIPSGLQPITGIEKIKEYWFPEDGSKTTIHSYTVELIELRGTDSLAFTLEKGILNFTYSLGDFTMTKESISHATSVYQKNTNGGWKIISRMWTSLKE